jgi:hypothetical protein
MNRRVLRILLFACLAMATAVGPVSGSASARTRTRARPRGHRTPNPGLDNLLTGVSAVSSSDVWAVGYDGDSNAGTFQTLILHWNGAAWSQVSSPNPSSTTNQLYGVSAVSSTDAWAVGGYTSQTGGATLILHWNGTTWSKVASPNPGAGFNVLYAVSADSGADAWAVGQFYNLSANTRDSPFTGTARNGRR